MQTYTPSEYQKLLRENCLKRSSHSSQKQLSELLLKLYGIYQIQLSQQPQYASDSETNITSAMVLIPIYVILSGGSPSVMRAQELWRL